ncbi:conserved oligomeric Golgi complex subunit 3 [Cylas formicarius]|uniref:conserved oligomeric Golgi complex subunit 3 n=1 Tax=Cylas formicarius TaxID=197179 RepID=UPI0029585906|nr:conserved oligomeric Golgi complex subunit 3 [Cylas formicarius]
MNVTEEDAIDKQIQENIADWHSSTNPLAPLDEEQIDLIYEIKDAVNALYYSETCDSRDDKKGEESENGIPVINSNKDFIRWIISAEREVQGEELNKYKDYWRVLSRYCAHCEQFFGLSDATLTSLNQLKQQYQNVTEKTNHLHDLSEQLLVHQEVLKGKKLAIEEKGRYFVYFNKAQDNVERLSDRPNSAEFTQILDNINDAIDYLSTNLTFKEAKIFKMKYENLLSGATTHVYNYVDGVIVASTRQVVSPEFKSHLLPMTSEAPADSAFSLYYGKFQSASIKVRVILEYLERAETRNDCYKNTLYDCKRSYFAQRQPILSVAVSKALTELRDKHRSDHSVLFRSCCLFMLKVCADEARCYDYFFGGACAQFRDYLRTLCQYLYDTLRPCLIGIHHVEILCELCGILKREMLTDTVLVNDRLSSYAEFVKQLLEDVEERLVFRTNLFFKHDLMEYKPSPGDLAYPEKLLQMENVVVDRSDSRSSTVSMDSQEVAHINMTPVQLRSYTGNSPADLHGMWYPTVKRTLVCLSRLYFCVDRDTFQGLAQEALIVCVKTVDRAAELIGQNKTAIDGRLFQIKHLLIVREQIAPFQVDFTTKELALDFTTVSKAAADLVHNRGKIFAIGTSNALLEFLLDGTPKVKEYLVDSRKEIDKQLKRSCESFISHATHMLIGSVSEFVGKAEHILKIVRAEDSSSNDLTVAGQGFGKPEVVAGIIKEAQKQIKIKIPELQRSMQLYLANRETEFILFRPVKNNILNGFMQVEQILARGGYSQDDQLQIACPSQEQINILICSVSLSGDQAVQKNS